MPMQDWVALAGSSIFWVAAFLVFAVVEGMTVSLVSVWFAAGALSALIASAFTDNFLVQTGVFLAVSLLTILTLYPLARKALNRQRVATNADRVIGMVGVVSEMVDNLNAKGQVRVAGTVWSARTDVEETIPQNARVRVLRIDGVKLIVSPVVAPAVTAGATGDQV